MPKLKEEIKGLFCPACAAEALFIKASDVAQSGRARYMCHRCQSRTTKPLKAPPQILPKFDKTRAQRYIITSAVNDTPINRKQFATYVKMAELLGARLIVIATVYKNPDATQGKLESLSWPVETLPYICQERFRINKHLDVRGDARIQATAVNPLQGANHCGGTHSEIFGHPQVAMELVPTPKNSIPKGLWTTGTISLPNYGGSWKAKKAEFHHSYSALLVEVSGGRFWPTQLGWDGKGVQLFNTYYTAEGAQEAPQIEAAVFGDVHADAQTKAERKLLQQAIATAKAKRNVLHDLLDFHTGSHHKKGKVLENLRSPVTCVRGELQRTLKFLTTVPNPVIVSSNHNDHLDQWFNETNPQKCEAHNLDIYFELGELARATRTSLFQAYIEKYNAGQAVEYTSPNVEFDVAGIDLSQHGHKGPNGSRGSGKGFARTGRKTIIGHSHTPGIYKGCWQVGTSAMEMAYAQGYSSWLIAHALVYKSGKRAMFFAIDGKFSPLFLAA